MKTEDLE